MGTWSTVCTNLFAKRILEVFEKRVNFFQSDRAVLNVCCLRTPDSCHMLFDNVMKNLERSIDRDRAIVYSLSRKEFTSQLWETSTKLLVLIEAQNCDTEEFNQELNLVTQFIADGGLVMVLIDPPRKKVSGNRPDFGSVLSDSLCSVSEQFSNEKSGISWLWSMHSPFLHPEGDPPSCNQTTRMLIGSGSDGRQRVVCFVAMLGDCVDQHPHLLQEGLRLLNIPLNNPVNDQFHTATMNPSEKVVLHYLVERSKQSPNCWPQITPDKMRSKLLTLKSTTNGAQYDVEPLYSTDPLLPDGFSWTTYLSTLQTHILGRALLWAESLPSSYSLCERLLPSLPADSGLVVVSNQQTEGRGRGSNRWISVHGQALFTFHMTLREPVIRTPNSNPSPPPFMNLVTLMQHLVALAIVFASRRILADRLDLIRPEDPEPDLEWIADLKLPGPAIRVKWPNDVYVVDDEVRSSTSDMNNANHGVLGKMAGLLTKCTMVDSRQVDFISGTGINVQNTIPSVCLQQLLDRIQPSALKITTAEVIAQVLNQLERLISSVLSPESKCGLDWLLDLYTKCWIHDNQRVLVHTPPIGSGDKPRLCIIVGLDKFGYLRVCDAHDGTQYTLHPDGNSMDMMRGLICPK